MAKTDKTALYNTFLNAINMHINGLWMNVVGHLKSFCPFLNPSNWEVSNENIPRKRLHLFYNTYNMDKSP